MTTDFITTIITRREMQAEGVVVLDLTPASGAALPGFEPGAHVDVEIEPGLVRQYSLCGDPADLARYRLGILRDPASRGGSAAVHDRFTEGRRVRIRPPRNLFPLDMAAPETVLVGGGIGITPMLAMAHALHRAGRRFTLHYCARNRASAAFLADLATAAFADRLRLHFDDGPAADRFDPAHDLPRAAVGAHVYVCGPAGFMDWLRQGCEAQGYPADRLHQEFFSADVDTAGDGFEVVLARSGRVVPVAAGQSVVAALTDVGVKIDVSCEKGICGTCICTVLEGEPDHRDVYLTEDERADNDQMALCCSRSKSPRLVLDL